MVIETSNDCEGVNLAVGVLFYKIAQLEKGCTSVVEVPWLKSWHPKTEKEGSIGGSFSGGMKIKMKI